MNKHDLQRLWLLNSQGKYVPNVGDMVLLMNHIGLFLINEIDVDTRTANVTRLVSNVQLERIPWSIIWHCDEMFLRGYATRMRSILD